LAIYEKFQRKIWGNNRRESGNISRIGFIFSAKDRQTKMPVYRGGISSKLEIVKKGGRRKRLRGDQASFQFSIHNRDQESQTEPAARSISEDAGQKTRLIVGRYHSIHIIPVF